MQFVWIFPLFSFEDEISTVVTGMSRHISTSLRYESAFDFRNLHTFLILLRYIVNEHEYNSVDAEKLFDNMENRIHRFLRRPSTILIHADGPPGWLALE